MSLKVYGFEGGDDFMAVYLSPSSCIHYTYTAFCMSIIPQESGLNNNKEEENIAKAFLSKMI